MKNTPVKVWNPQWDRYMDVDRKLANLMKAAGYETWHTGGGCMAWYRGLNGSGYLMITYGDVELGSWADHDKAEWLVGRYTADGDGWVMWGRAETLTQAIAIGTKLPAPDPESDRTIDILPPEWS